MVLCDLDEYQLALDYSKKSLSLGHEVLPEKHPQLARTHLIIGLIHHDMGNYDDALKSYEKASEIDRISLTFDHPIEAIVQANLGITYIAKGDFQTAIEKTNKALVAFAKFEGHPTLAVMYSNLGLAYLHCNNYSLAAENFEKALQIQLISLPGCHSNIATSYNNLATIYFEEDKYHMALENYNKALEMQLQCFPSKLNSHIALTYNNIGTIYYRLERYSLALKNFEEALIIMDKCLPVGHFDFSVVYNNMGLIYASNEEYTRALNYYNKALDTPMLQNHPFTARTYLNIGDIHRMTNNNDLALEMYKKSLAIQMECSTQNSKDLLQTYHALCIVCDDMNEKEMTLDFEKKFLEYLLIERPLDFDEHITTYTNIGDLLFSTDNLKAAKEYYEKAMDAVEKTSSPCPEAIQHIQDMFHSLRLAALVSHSNEETENIDD